MNLSVGAIVESREVSALPYITGKSILMISHMHIFKEKKIKKLTKTLLRCKIQQVELMMRLFRNSLNIFDETY